MSAAVAISVDSCALPVIAWVNDDLFGRGANVADALAALDADLAQRCPLYGEHRFEWVEEPLCQPKHVALYDHEGWPTHKYTYLCDCGEEGEVRRD